MQRRNFRNRRVDRVGGKVDAVVVDDVDVADDVCDRLAMPALRFAACAIVEWPLDARNRDQLAAD